MFLWNYSTPLWDDDLEPAKYSGVLEILAQTKADYFGWNGRIVGQTLFRLLSVGDHLLVSLLNATVFVIFIRLIYALVKKDRDNLLYMTITLFLVLTLPVFGQTILWKAGAGNYLWVVTINLAFIYIYIYKASGFFNKKTSIMGIVATIFFLVLAVIAGIGNENTSGGTLLLILMVLGTKIVNKQKVTMVEVLGIIFNFIGYMILIFSPSAKIRTIATLGESYYDTPLLVRGMKGFLALNETIYKFYLPLLVLIVVFVTWRYIYNTDKKRFIYGLEWIIAGAGIIYALAFSPLGQDGGRPFFGGIVFITIGIFILCPMELQHGDEKIGLFLKYVLVFGVLLASFLIIPRGLYDSVKSNIAISSRYEYIQKEARKHKNEIIKVSPLSYYAQTKYSVNYQLEEIKNDAQAWPNNLYNDFFNIRGVELK